LERTVQELHHLGSQQQRQLQEQQQQLQEQQQQLQQQQQQLLQQQQTVAVLMARAQAQFQLGNRQAAAGEDFDSSAQSSCAIMTDSRNS
jgi:peptidoglycan hydrolase CwlO-like protein